MSGSAPQLIDVETLFSNPEFAGASLSPDGTRIAYLAPRHGRLNVWVRGIDEHHEDAVCVTHDVRRSISTYTWTTDPRWLLYLQDTDGNEDWHLYRVDLEKPDAAAVDLTPLDPGSRVIEFVPMAGAPGTFLVSMNRRPDRLDTFRVDVATGETVLHRESPDSNGRFFFGPAGETYYLTHAQDGTWEYFAVDDETGAMRRFYQQDGVEHPLVVHPAQITADGTGLLVGDYHGGDELKLLRVDIETGDTTVVASMPGRSLCAAAAVNPAAPPTLFASRRDGRLLAARFVGDRPTIQVLDPDFAEVYAALSDLCDGVLASVSSDRDEQRWIATFAHDREPGLTYLYDHGSGESRLLYRPYPQLEPLVLAPMTGVHLTARDGLPLHAFLTLPVGAAPVNLPLVLIVHGGPWAHDVWGYNPGAQFLANRGYAVLQVNFRGSSGYGRRHMVAADGEYARAMHDDLIDAADWAVEQGYADPDRIGIYGGSYGGYSALLAVTVTPDYFAAAVDYCGISHVPSFMRALPTFVRPTMMIRSRFHVQWGDPEDLDQEAVQLARSPLTMVDRIQTPLLVMQGAQDRRVVKAEADNIVQALTERGVPVEYLLADDEGHGFNNPENVAASFRAVEQHFAEHLGGPKHRTPTSSLRSSGP